MIDSAAALTIPDSFEIPEINIDVGGPAIRDTLPLGTGANICIRGVQGTGKTKLLVGFIQRAIARHGYRWENTTGNFTMFADRRNGLYQPGYTYKNNAAIKKWVHKVYRSHQGDYLNQIIAIDEIDQVYPHLDSLNQDDKEDLLTLWQDQKLGNLFIYTKHVGRGCNKLIRNATEISIKPFTDKANDVLYGQVIDGIFGVPRLLTFTHESRLHNYYWRWEPIH